MSGLFSIVVISHNYERYLRQAIDSALDQEYESVQVIVVDDGSTDGSQELIRGYGKRVRAIFKANGGNSTAINAAFPSCEGEAVLFLDADDFLYPHAASRIMAAWDGRAAKLEFRLALVDASGVRRGVEPPAMAPLPQGDVVGEIASWGHYVTPVLGGNAFSRSTLGRLLPIPDEPLFRNHNDGYLNPLCAFCGPIASLDEELGAYRLHGGNQWAYAGAIGLDRLHERLRHELVRERYLQEAARRQRRKLPPQLMLRNSVHVVQRLASLKLDPGSHPVPDDTVIRLTRALPGSVVRNPELSAMEKAFTVAVGALLAGSPRRLAAAPVEWMLASRPRPRWQRVVVRAVRAVTALPRTLPRVRSQR